MRRLLLLLLIQIVALSAASGFPWEGGVRSLVTVRNELCPVLFRPFKHDPLLFHSKSGEQACCVLDRAIGAIEILHNVRKCRAFQKTTAPDSGAAVKPWLDHSGDDGSRAMLMLPQGVVTPCSPGAVDALAGSLLACCGDIRGHASSYAVCAAALAGGAIKRAVGRLKEWYGMCARRQNKRGQDLNIPLPVYDSMCENAEDAAIGLLRALHDAARDLYRTSPKDAVHAAKRFMSLCSDSTGPWVGRTATPAKVAAEKEAKAHEKSAKAQTSTEASHGRQSRRLGRAGMPKRAEDYAHFAAERHAKGSEQRAKDKSRAAWLRAAGSETVTTTRAPLPVCPAGKHARHHFATPSERCGDCRAGRFSKAGKKCQNCPRGKYQPMAGKPKCKDCQWCPFGQHMHHCEGVQSGKCHRCPTGTYSGGTAELSPDACIPCSPCPKGNYDTQCGGNKRGQCYQCPSGKYKEEEGQWNTRCKHCKTCAKRRPAAHTASDLDRWHVLSWTKHCGGASRGKCEMTDDVPVDTLCKRCAPGQFEDKNGKCESCPWGKFTPRCDTPSCTTCPQGKYQAGVGKSQCFACGSCPETQTRHGCTGRYPGTCHRCKAGRYATVDLAPTGKVASCEACKQCPPGRYDHLCGGNRASHCVACTAGKYLVRYQTITKHEGRGCRMCAACPKGQGVRLRCGGEHPGWCSLGPQPAPTPSPTPQPTPSPTPHKCGRGAFRASQVVLCVACPRGKFNSELEQKACRDCPSGKFGAHRGGEACATCVACPQGQGYPSDSPCAVASAGSCVPVPTPPPATAAPTPAPTPHLRCRWGEFLTSWENAACEPCPKGKFSHYGWNKCKPCPVGRYVDEPAMGACKECRPCTDPWAALQGCASASAGSCGACPKGQHFAKLSVCDGKVCSKLRVCRQCQICPLGQYAWDCQGHSTGKCRACPNGKYNSGNDLAVAPSSNDDLGVVSAEIYGCKACRCPDPKTLIMGCDPKTGPVCVSGYVHDAKKKRAVQPGAKESLEPERNTPPPTPTTAAPSPAPTPGADACLPAILSWATEHLGLPDDWAQ